MLSCERAPAGAGCFGQRWPGGLLPWFSREKKATQEEMMGMAPVAWGRLRRPAGSREPAGLPVCCGHLLSSSSSGADLNSIQSVQHGPAVVIVAHGPSFLGRVGRAQRDGPLKLKVACVGGEGHEEGGGCSRSWLRARQRLLCTAAAPLLHKPLYRPLAAGAPLSSSSKK